MAIPFLKGHGTENDFVLLPDPDGDLDLTASRVQALCDRQRGLGADGVLRVVRAKALPDAPAGVDGDVWFMDYRNADGSVVEMCGNGVRVFARYLSDHGLVDGPEFPVGSRAGIRPTTVHPDGTVTVGMGRVRLLGASTTTVGGTTHTGLGVDVGNPHLVSVVESVADLDLTAQPGFDREFFPHGVNLEFIETTGPAEIRMRVHERGVGETRSCGTGTVAAAAAALATQNRSTGAVTVHIPGGTVHVTIDDTSSTLTGPAFFVAEGTLTEAWWNTYA
ncbi:diaminopimelate epimerase [Actinokineospora baliensis]|uniref:diaminopimelate epimerase n=1 Tax=Actinokineospora baliensis TaxID=547056 RepID=UPI00195618FD|nr:diaminopimelate epimerase [Actinokineospora baliensis]MBM7776366.1 diaminopimelate epimerase [Actinokineospora baliensis]